jgi:fructoselysine-6-P-deglycase FrlB-like protein
VESIDKSSRTGEGTHSVRLMEREIENQVFELPAFTSELATAQDQDVDLSDMVFTGSGDSYATSLFAHYLSDGLARAGDPRDLAESRMLCRDKNVFITSVSGRTRANIILARRIRKIARKRVAITANPTSSLAHECDETIRFPYRRQDALTPGTLSFTLSILAAASRIRSLPKLRNLDAVNGSAKTWANDLDVSPRDASVFVGSGITYPLAAYGAFKIHETIGEPADYVHFEQFGHSKLFSVGESDNIFFLGSSQDEKVSSVSRELASNDFRSHFISSGSKDPIVAAVDLAFHIQHLALSLAKRRRLNEVAFLTDEKRLKLSSRLIY